MSSTEIFTEAERKLQVPGGIVGLKGRDPTTVSQILTEPERRLKGTLHAVAVFYLAIFVVALVSSFAGPFRAALSAAPWTDGLAGRAAVLLLLATYAGGDPRRRGALVNALAAALGVSALAGAAYLAGGIGGVIDPWILVGSSVIDAVIAVVVLRAWSAAKSARREQEEAGTGLAAAPEWSDGLNAGAIRVLLWPVGIGFLAMAAADLAGPFVPGLEQLFAEPLLTAHLAARDLAIALACFFVARSPRLQLPAVSVVTGAIVLAAVARIFAVFGLVAPGFRVPVFGTYFDARTLLLAVTGVEIAAFLAIWFTKNSIYTRFFKPQFLKAAEYRTLIALSDVLVLGPERAVPPADIARNVDGHIAKISATRKWIHRLALRVLQAHPVLYVKAPLSELDEEGRLDHLKVHFHNDVLLPLVPDVYRRVVQAMIRIGQQLAYVGYYNDQRAWPTVGYQEFEKRDRFRVIQQAGYKRPEDPELKVQLPDDVKQTTVEADVCIIGSGAAGGVLAYHLAKAGNTVVVLERGKHVRPETFTADEVAMMGALYGDGVFQQTEDFRFTVLQGSAVGGTTVVNNAVSFNTPEPVLDHWNRALLAGIDPAEYYAATAAVRDWLKIRPQDEGSAYNPFSRLNPSYPRYLDGVKNLGIPESRLKVAPVDANIEGCLGCGYCNIGCKYNAKLSMLVTTLPQAQREFGDQVRIFAECTVQRIATHESGQTRKATEAIAQLSDGRTIRVKAKKFVVSAGTVASSFLLQQSGIGKGLPVGRHVCFNMGAPITAEFDDDMDAFDGLQISHYGQPQAQRGWVYETWFNPPVAQAINMPGWFEQHYQNMRRYRKLMAVGALVGTERNAWIGKALTGGAAINYVPTQGDRRKLADGLMELGQILFAGGARRLMLNAWTYTEFTSPNALSEIPAIALDPYQLTLGTGHPQGGNAISRDPSLGVVDPNFKVHGYANLFVCDASVFPSATTVNPQLTVMSLAQYAAPRIADARVG